MKTGRFELFIALRYLLSLRRQAFISLISLFAVLGVCLGVASLIVVMGVMNGFSHDLREKIVGVTSHVIVGSFRGAIKDYQDVAEKIAKVPGVDAVTPFVYAEVMLSNNSGVKGVILRGIEPKSAAKVFAIQKDMVAGSLYDLDQGGPFPGVVVGRELAERLGLHLGARVSLLSPTGEKSAAGFTPKIKFFTVVGIFRTGMYEYDSSLVYVSKSAAQDLLGIDGDLVTGLEVRLKDLDQAASVGDAIRSIIEYPLWVRTWMEMNANLFAAMKLEKTAMFIILALIVLVGSFSIVTTLVMLVMKKTRDIAVLMSLGLSESRIRKIFMLQGTIIGAVGTVLGFGLGLPVAFLLRKYEFIKLPKNVYPVDYLPIRLETWDLVIIGLASFLLCFLATLYPAKRASSLNPTEALRYE
ncbi:lipoprotein releasing system, transmembrane protein, LolC/E family [Desulfovibrio sp. X2]|uniref:lipoprotein-releasing ABC transporter permease subunit n=1 Tax=Desulfovibrio sp. X2 TaxID=941449 RepID=UPI00035884B2|nr:lipoprotein-releasing ABC transporter permease subunit [Desulfovibrio sp. X2]EPR37477.1 lipoprotein releasing system, transmembrane protein, LolC/E family [Desulfovibrio sp. X2]